MILQPSAEDEAFLTRLFGTRIPPDDTSFRPALEWRYHVDISTDAVPDEGAWERCGVPMMHNLVSACLHNGLGRPPLGWSLEEVGGQICLGVLVMKQQGKKAA